MNKTNKEIMYTDFPLYKELNKNGELKIYNNSDAIFQSLKIWLSCERHEKIRSDGGGYITPFIGKPLDDITANQIKTTLQIGLTQDFYPPLTLVDLQVIPDKERNYWIINIAGYNSTLNIGINDYVIISNNI